MELLDKRFIKLMREIGEYGDRINKDGGWRRPIRPRRSPMNHLLLHYIAFQGNKPHKLNHKKYHLAAIAFNAMMEFYWLDKEEK